MLQIQDAKKESSWMIDRIMSAGCLLVLLAALALHWRVAAVLLDSSLHDDQIKHFTSGVMVYDYLRTGLGSNPIHFAEDFEVRYPEVAIGHWPPMYYAIQAIYYLAAGPTIQSARILSAITAAFLAVLLFVRAAQHAGMGIGLISAAIFLSEPLVQTAAWQVMSDLLTALFVFLAIRELSRFLEDNHSSTAAIGFAVWATAAILTKGSAWALGPFALLAPLLARRTHCFRSIRYWAFGLIVVALSAPFYVLAQHLGFGYRGNYSHIASPAVSLTERIFNLAPLVNFAPVLLLGLSALGLADAIYARWFRDDESSWTTLSLVAAAWIVAQVIFLFFLPLTSEPRVLMPSIAPVSLLAARSLLWAKHLLRHWALVAAASPVAIGVLFVASAGAVPLERFDGYREAAAAMPYAEDGSLIFAAVERLPGGGDGSLIAERLSHDRLHKDVILRADHVLLQVDDEGNCQTRLDGVDAVRSYLLQMPVRFAVLGGPTDPCGYQPVIDKAVAGDPGDFHLIATVPIVERGEGQFDLIRIYENPAARTRHPSVVRTPMGLDGGSRVLAYRWR